jgi:hypothetical protein
MPKFLVKCNYEKLYAAEIDAELPEYEDELREFMSEYEDENEVAWTEVNMTLDYSGYPVQT